MSVRSRVVRTFNRPLTRWPLALAGSLVVTRRNHELALVTPFSEGLFAHRYRDGVVVYPSLRGISPRRMRTEAVDTFCWDYQPGQGDVVLDVGAGIGEEALAFSQMVGLNGRVICVEAQPATYRRLVAAVALNKLDNVTTVPSAMTDTIGDVWIEEAAEETHVGASLTSAGGIRVLGETVDALTDRLNLREVALLKMNIEGAEHRALEGANETLKRTRHVAISCHDFLVEHGANPTDVATFDAVRQLLERHGFHIRTRQDDPRSWIKYYLYGSRA